MPRLKDLPFPKTNIQTGTDGLPGDTIGMHSFKDLTLRPTGKTL